MTSAKSGNGAEPSTSSAAPRNGRMGWEQLVAAIKDDYSQDYFVSGKGSMEAYAGEGLMLGVQIRVFMHFYELDLKLKGERLC